MKASTILSTAFGVLSPLLLFSYGMESTDDGSQATLLGDDSDKMIRGRNLLLEVVSKGGIPNELDLCQGDLRFSLLRTKLSELKFGEIGEELEKCGEHVCASTVLLRNVGAFLKLTF